MDYMACRKDDEDFRQSLDDMRESGTFCDATIHIPGDERVLPVHRAVMASCSEFFRSLFIGGFQETRQHVVKIHGVSFYAMNLIVKYAYTNKIDITGENVEEIFAAADRFNILGLFDDCINFLIKETCPENCIGILRFARIYNCNELADKTWAFITGHFEEVIATSDEYFFLEVDELYELLQEDTLNIKSEDEVFEAVVKWVEFNPQLRKHYFIRLLQTVRLPYCSEEYFHKQISSRRDLKRGPCSEKIQMSNSLIKRFRSSKDPTIKTQTSKIAKWVQPRIPNSVIFVIGGWAKEGVTDIVETYDRNTDQWFKVRECVLPSARAYHGSIVLDGKVYVLGGFNGNVYLNSMICFNVVSKTWEEKAPMYLSRCYVSVATHNGTLYAIGGFDGRQRHNTVEKYDRDKNQWTMMKPMYHNRSDAGSVTFNDRIYVAGGFDGQSCLMTAEVYDPLADQWTELAPMSTRRSGVSLAVCGAKIFAIGGYDGMRRLTSVEYLYGRRLHWYSAPNMIVGRSNFSCTVMDDVIYVMGGFDGDKTSAQVECFNPLRKQWTVLNDMHVGRSAVSACVVSGMPNSRDFTYHGNRASDELAGCCLAEDSEPPVSCWGDRDPLFIDVVDEEIV